MKAESSRVSFPGLDPATKGDGITEDEVTKESIPDRIAIFV